MLGSIPRLLLVKDSMVVHLTAVKLMEEFSENRLQKATSCDMPTRMQLHQNSDVFDASTAAAGEITGLYMIDDEGEVMTSDVNTNLFDWEAAEY